MLQSAMSMNMASWRDFLRPIRDGLHKLLPSPPEESKEEKEARKIKESLYGFTSFETFEELAEWSPIDANRIQIASMPLFKRPECSEDEKARILMVHDYAGGYHAEESIGPFEGVDNQGFSCEELQRVEAFVYFSHRLCTVPPPAWTNALHRNGVKSLGTLIVESGTKGAEALLEQAVEGKGKKCYTAARKLARIAKIYGFDGWLINIELAFADSVWRWSDLLGFLTELRQRLGENGQLVWYDALTRNNKVEYQNTVNALNVPFLEACGHLLTNYAWELKDIDSALKSAVQKGIHSSRIYFGVDIWAQNQPQSCLYPRVTYPKSNGGGTNTGVAVRAAVEKGVCVGLFGPAWPWEHFGPVQGPAVNRSMWEGINLLADISCSCLNSKGDFKGHAAFSPNEAINFNASCSPAGCSHFFWTDFSSAYGLHSPDLNSLYGDKPLHAQLASQSVLPVSWRGMSDKNKDSPWLEISDKLIIGLPVDMAKPSFYASLYCLDLDIESGVNICVTYKTLCEKVKASLHFTVESENKLRYWDVKLSPTNGRISKLEFNMDKLETMMRCKFPHDLKKLRIRELGINVEQIKFDLESPTPILELHNLAIICAEGAYKIPDVKINDIRIESHGSNQSEHYRLCWNVQECSPFMPGYWVTVNSSTEAFEFANSITNTKHGECVPRSPITGSIAHFLLKVEGKPVGRVYGHEVVLPMTLVNRWRGEGIEVTIAPVQFGGRMARERTVKLQLQTDFGDWEFVPRTL